MLPVAMVTAQFVVSPSTFVSVEKRIKGKEVDVIPSNWFISVDVSKKQGKTEFVEEKSVEVSS